MQKLIIVFILLNITVTYNPLSAQSDWEYCLVRGDSHEVEVFGNTAFIANSSGLLKIDLYTHEETFIHPANHTVEVQGFKELELLDDGHMWLTSAEDGNLFYYDGLTFTPYCDSLNQIENLVYAENKLWFFSFSNLYSFDGLNCFNHGDLEIIGATSDSDGRFWFITSDSLNQYNGDSIVVSKALPSQIYVVQDYFIDSEDKHWIAYGTAPHLMQYNNGSWEETFTSNFLEKFYELESGQVSAVLQNNKYVLFNGIQDVEIDLFRNLPEDFNIIHMETKDSFWFTTEKMFHSSRLFWSTPDSLLELMDYNDLIPATIVDLTKDCNGNLLSSTRTFINKLIDNNWQPILYNSIGQDCYLARFVEDKFSCETWITPSYKNGRYCQYVWELSADTLIPHEILPQQELYLHRDIEGNVWYTDSYPGRIYKVDSVGNVTFVNVPGSEVISDIEFLADEKIAALSIRDSIDQRHSIRIFDDNNWYKLNLDSLGIADMQLRRFMLTDRNGNLWINEKNGLIRYDGSQLYYYPFEQAFALVNMIEDMYGSFWISTTKHGLIRWSPDTTILYNTRNSQLLSNACRELQIIDNHLWINHYYGLSTFKINPLENTTQNINAELLQYNIYPNPSLGQISISNPLNAYWNVDFYTIDGVHLSNYNGNENKWNITLSAGVYLVRIRQGYSEVFEKIIITQ